MNGTIFAEVLKMREISVSLISKEIAKMCISANCKVSKDIKCALENSISVEQSELGRNVLEQLIENAEIARKEEIPICQDTGMAVVFLEIGQDVRLIDGSLEDAVNEGVRKGYADGYLRKSVVSDPLRRVNTNDNTPAIIYTKIIDGDKVKIILSPKGFGSENMSAVKMLMPSDGMEGVVDFVIETVNKAGSNPCPPIVVGIGIGGTMEKACLLAKQALTRDIRESNADEYYAGLEEELLEKINELGIGPQGLSGTITALGVNVETFATHIAGLPVAVNIGCHVNRHESVEI